MAVRCDQRVVQPLLALGIITHPEHVAHRKWLRESHAPVACAVTARFLVGRGTRVADAEHNDILELQAREGTEWTHGGAHAVAEKALAWYIHAVAAWPEMPFIGKTDDDTLISMPVLMRDLAALRYHSYVLYGYTHWGIFRPEENTCFSNDSVVFPRGAHRYGPYPFLVGQFEVLSGSLAT